MYALIYARQADAVVREAEKASAVPVPTVDAAAGQPLKGTNILAGKSDPLALSGDEYPAWLRAEVERPTKLDPERFVKSGVPPTRTELRRLTKIKIRANNAERCA